MSYVADVFTAGLVMFHLLCNGCHAFDDDAEGDEEGASSLAPQLPS